MNGIFRTVFWNVIKNPFCQVSKFPTILASTYSNSSQKLFSTLSILPKHNYVVQSSYLLSRLDVNSLNFNNTSVQTRNLTKFSLRKGKRKTVKAVLKRFYRLDWGIWIRGKCGRAKKLYRKSANRKRRLRQHVFCNATQSYLLDKMVTNYWRKPKYYVDDPYEPYHKREEFNITRKKPILPKTL
uniref:Large ribosomal subunit protein bL35m n=1 Tax=Panstrongylus megistus TaxID=65343 RepID=A0A069DPK1_9HEMI